MAGFVSIFQSFKIAHAEDLQIICPGGQYDESRSDPKGPCLPCPPGTLPYLERRIGVFKVYYESFCLSAKETNASTYKTPPRKLKPGDPNYKDTTASNLAPTVEFTFFSQADMTGQTDQQAKEALVNALNKMKFSSNVIADQIAKTVLSNAVNRTNGNPNQSGGNKSSGFGLFAGLSIKF